MDPLTSFCHWLPLPGQQGQMKNSPRGALPGKRTYKSHRHGAPKLPKSYTNPPSCLTSPLSFSLGPILPQYDRHFFPLRSTSYVEHVTRVRAHISFSHAVPHEHGPICPRDGHTVAPPLVFWGGYPAGGRNDRKHFPACKALSLQLRLHQRRFADPHRRLCVKRSRTTTTRLRGWRRLDHNMHY